MDTARQADLTNKHPLKRARSSLAGKRRSVLLEATELFCNLVRPSAKQISKFKEQFYLLVDSSSFQDRRIISATLSHNEYTPRTIAFYLAMETHEIAAPVLLVSPVLQESDLLNIMSKTSPEHSSIIARRSNLTPPVCEVIAKHGNEEAYDRLMTNPSIREYSGLEERLREIRRENMGETITRVSEPEALAINAEADKTEASTTVASEPADNRQLQSQGQAAQQDKTSSDSRNELLEIAARGGKLGKQAERKQTEDTQAERRKEVASQKPAPKRPAGQPVNGIIATTCEGIGGELLKHARKRDVDECARIVERHCGLKFTTARQLLREPGGESICLMLKALAVPKGTASQILLLINRESGRSVDIFKRLINRYGTLETKVCQDMLIRLGASFDNLSAAAAPVHETRRRRDDPDNFAQAVQGRRMALRGEHETGQPQSGNSSRKSA